MSLQVSLFDWLYNIISSQFNATTAKCSEIFNYTGSYQLTIYRTTVSTKHFITSNQLIKNTAKCVCSDYKQLQRNYTEDFSTKSIWLKTIPSCLYKQIWVLITVIRQKCDRGNYTSR